MQKEKKAVKGSLADQAQRREGARFPSVAPSSKWRLRKILSLEAARGTASGYLAI